MARQSEQPSLVRRWHRRLYRTFFRRSLARYPRRELDGVALYFESSQAERILAALVLLRAADPPRYRRVRRYLRLLTASDLGTHYDVTADAGCIDVEQEGEGWMLAAALVHEATHAYLLKARGMPYFGPWMRHQERICLREELRCLRRLVRHSGCTRAEATTLLERVEASHREALAREWWNAPLLTQLRASGRLWSFGLAES